MRNERHAKTRTSVVDTESSSGDRPSLLNMGVADAPATRAPSASPSEDEAELHDRAPRAVPVPVRTGRWLVSDTPAGRAVSAHFDTFDAAGPSAQAHFEASLAQLRQHPRESVWELKQLYDATEKGDIATRSLATSALRQLESHEATEALREIATEALPPFPPAQQGGHDDTGIREEAMIRFAAMDGLGSLAARGNVDALSTLEQLIKEGGPLIRRYAAGEYVEANGYSRDSRVHAASLLPEQDKGAVDARPLHPDDRPMPAPEQPSSNPKKTLKEKHASVWVEADAGSTQ